MPRGRVSEMAPRVATRGPNSLRSSSSDSDPLHNRPVTDRSPKLGDRRSPRSAHSDPLNQKKLGTRIAGLETQLEQAQGELKVLKDQLASAEAAKKEAQKELEKRNSKAVVSEHGSHEIGEEHESPNENQKETDVFEVPIEMVSVEHKVEGSKDGDQVEGNVNISLESMEKPVFDEGIAVKNDELSELKVKIEEKDRKLEAFREENENLKLQLSEANVQISSAMVKEEKMKLTLTELEEELKKSQNDGMQLKEKVKEVEAAKDALETEMKRLRVQTEQWRKAADAAAAILSGGAEMNGGRRVAERCGSMDKPYGGVFDGYSGFVGSPGLGDDSDDGFGNGKRKGSGIRMFGDLWKKKGQK